MNFSSSGGSSSLVEFEPNNNTFDATRTESGRTYSGRVMDNSDNDYWLLPVASDGVVTARFISEGSRNNSHYFTISLINSSGVLLDQTESAQGYDASLIANVRSGEVYLVVEKGYYHSSERYSLALEYPSKPASRPDLVAMQGYPSRSETGIISTGSYIAGDPIYHWFDYKNVSAADLNVPLIVQEKTNGVTTSFGEVSSEKNVDLSVFVTTTGLLGSNSIEFFLDPDDDIQESDESNNRSSFTYICEHPLRILSQNFRSGNMIGDPEIESSMEVGTKAFQWIELKNNSVNERSFEWLIYKDGALVSTPTTFVLPANSGSMPYIIEFNPQVAEKNFTVSAITTDGMPTLYDTLHYEIVEPQVSNPQLSYFPATLDFGSVRRARESALSFVIGNTGAAPLRVLNLVSTSSAISFSGDASFSANSFTVEAGGEKTVSVSLYPTTGGRIEEEIRFSTNDPENSSVKIPVKAVVSTESETGVLTLPIAILDFGEVEVGQIERLNIPVRNDGVADLTVFNVVTDNRLIRLAPTTFTVLPGATRTIVATLAPQPNKALSGAITINSNDPTTPGKTLNWEASLVASNYLALASSFPASRDRRVATDTEFELVFDEALFQRGRYVDLDVAVFPPPVSGPLMDSFELRGRGNTVLFPVELADDTEYRMVVYGASSASGAELFDPIEIPFTTGSRFQASGSLSGAIDVGPLADEDYIVGNVSLFDDGRKLVAREPIGADGTYAVANLAEGAYYVVADVRLSDGRDIEVAYDTDGDGASDAVRVDAGVGIEEVNLIYDDTRSVVAPGRLDATKYTLDVGQAYGDQGQDELTIASGEQFHVSVYANNVDALTGYAVSALYDSTAVELLRATEDLLGEGTNLLKRTGGMPLFLGSDVLGDVVSVGGALLAPSADESASGSGLVATFRFAAKNGFEGDTRIKLVEVVQKSFGAIDTSEVDVVSTIRVSSIAVDTAEPTEESDLPDGLFTLDLDASAGDQQQRLRHGAVVGGVYQVQIYGSQLPEIKGWSAIINYDQTSVKVVANSFAPGSFLPGIIALTTDEDGTLSAGGSLLGSSSGASGDGFLGTVSFEVLDGFTTSTDLYISETNLRLSEGGQAKTSVYHKVTLSGEIISVGIPGDFDGSGGVDFADFFMFADGFGGTDPAYDLDDSGKVDFADFFVFADNFGRKEEVAKLIALAEQMLGLPTQTGLDPNYPNPFNAETTLPYRVGSPGDIIIDIYDLSGQRIRRLVDAYHSVGQYRVSWDGRDQRSMVSSSGMYIVSIRGDRVSSARKIMLMK